MEANAEPSDAAADVAAESVATVDRTAEANSEMLQQEYLLSRAESLISKIISAASNPNPRQLHALASILEEQESRCVQESGSSNNARSSSSQPIGRLINLVRDNEEFYELISSRFLSESRYNISIRAAASRVLLGCPSNGVYPHVFDDTVVDNFKSWIVDDVFDGSADMCNWKRELGRNKPTDYEMLKTYATGLLAMSLAGGTKVMEDILTSGLSAKLMRYLRMRILGDTNSSQKELVSVSEAKHSLGSTSTKVRDENKAKSCQVLDEAMFAESLSDDQITEKYQEKNDWQGGSVLLKIDHATNLTEAIYREGDVTVGDEWKNTDVLDEKLKICEKHVARPVHDDYDDILMAASQHRRTGKGWPRLRGKGRTSEDPKKGCISLKNSVRSAAFLLRVEEDNDDRFTECLIGSMNISESIKKAIRAAEMEARAAEAPSEAIKAAGDAAAELVRSAAFEVWKSTSDEHAAVLAASEAASTVVDAAIATKLSRSPLDYSDGLGKSKVTEFEPTEELEEFFIIDVKSLAQLREKYSILCLQRLGEYVEALGPVLHEKGVDVCLALLQRYSRGGEACNNLDLLPEVLKLVCTLVAHKKFASLFVDRGGMQKLLAVCRASHTFVGISSCLFTIGSLQGVMERVCALSFDNVYQMVELTLKLLECSQELARKNAAIFLASAFVFRAILDTFDAQDGMQTMLNLLRSAASVRSGGITRMLGMSVTDMRNDRTSAEVLSSQEKAIAYHTCVALRQYFRAHLLLLVDSLRPNKSSRNGPRGSSARAPYRPLDISNESMDVVFKQIQRDRRLGSAFVRARWPAIEQFLASSGHIVMLELCQAPTGERYLHDLAQYALGVLYIATLLPYGRKLIVNATLSNNRLGMAVILDAANGSGYVEPEVIQSALCVLVNLVCSPPSISNKPSLPASNLQSTSTNVHNGFALENRQWNFEQNMSEGNIIFPSLNEFREFGRGVGTASSSSQTTTPSMSSGVVGDHKVSLGPGAGCAGLAAQLERGYRQAREAVRANNGIKVLLNLLQPRMITPLQALDSIRALACRALLGLARDETIAHILTKLQVGKKLSELIRDLGSQSSGNEPNRWHAELSQVAIELIAIVTNSGRASTLVATDAAAPTLKRIERAAIAAATPITYHSRELLLLIHEHLQFSGLTAAAAVLKKEAALIPLPSFSGTPILHQTTAQDTSALQLRWPSNCAPCGFLICGSKQNSDITQGSSQKKSLVFASNLLVGKTQIHSELEILQPGIKPNVGVNSGIKSPIALPMKRKLTELKDPSSMTPEAKRPSSRITAVDFSDEIHCLSVTGAPATPSFLPLGIPADQLPGNTERISLDSLVVQYLKHQHRQCPAPITTLPPLSLLHPHVCLEPSHSLQAPANVVARASNREIGQRHCGIHMGLRDRQFVYSRFRPWRTCRDDASLLTCIAFMGNSERIVTGSHSGELKIFDINNGNLLENNACHQTPILMIQSAVSGNTQLILSSGTPEVKLWDTSSFSHGPFHSFNACKAARFGNLRTTFAALSTDALRHEVLLFDIHTCNLELRLSDSSSNSSGTVRGNAQSLVHFSPLDTMLLWNGILWDRRSASPLHRFDQFTDFGGGGFHPAGNEVILNSEVWDLRKLKLLRSVPSLDQTVITFNSGGDVIYAILRRNLEDITSSVNARRVRHPLFPAFRTVDSTNYSEIATVPVDRCVLDFATDETDSYVGVVAMDDHEEMFSSAKLYEIGRRRPTDDDSDPDDGGETEDDEEEDEEDNEADLDSILESESDGERGSLSDYMSNNEDDRNINSSDELELDEESDFGIGDSNFGRGRGLLELMTESDGGDDDAEPGS